MAPWLCGPQLVHGLLELLLVEEINFAPCVILSNFMHLLCTRFIQSYFYVKQKRQKDENEDGAQNDDEKRQKRSSEGTHTQFMIPALGKREWFFSLPAWVDDSSTLASEMLLKYWCHSDLKTNMRCDGVIMKKKAGDIYRKECRFDYKLKVSCHLF